MFPLKIHLILLFPMYYRTLPSLQIFCLFRRGLGLPLDAAFCSEPQLKGLQEAGAATHGAANFIRTKVKNGINWL